MESQEKNKVCGVEKAGILDFNFRKLLQHPRKILSPFIKEGMDVLDIGCGPGYFTLEIAKLVGPRGKVVAADLQVGMLEIVKRKIKKSNLQDIVELHQCQGDKVGLRKEFDFILIFYVLHEVPDQKVFLQEVFSLLKPGGKVLIVEPKFHVTKEDFSNSTGILRKIGFDIIEKPKVFFSRSLLVSKGVEI